MPNTIDPQIPDGTAVEKIVYDEKELAFDSATLRNVGSEQLADYRLSIDLDSTGASDFYDLQLEETKPEVTIETEHGNSHFARLVIGNIRMESGGSTDIQAHVEFYPEPED